MRRRRHASPAHRAAPDLSRQAGGGLGWSFANTVIARLGTLVCGIVVARILEPDSYGLFAVGFVVLTVLLSMNDLGVSQAVVRETGDVGRVAPTVITLSIGTSLVLYAACFVAAPWIADLLGAPAATGVIRLLGVGVVIDAAVAVPAALLTRAFRQRRRLLIDLVSLVVANSLTISLAVAGAGAWSLAIGATAGTAIGGVLTILSVPERHRPGLDPLVARELIHFGLPLAGASLILFLLLNVDYVVVGHRLGPTQLGLYLLAFNLCTWPLSIVVTAVRRVALPAFAAARTHADAGAGAFTRVLALTLLATVPLCVLLALFGAPLVQLLYGTRWAAAGPVVQILAALTVGRVITEVVYDYLVAIGRTRSSMTVYVWWLVALVPAMVVGVRVDGIRGAAIAHALVVATVLPVLALTIARTGVDLRRLGRLLVRPLVGAAVMLTLGLGARLLTDDGPLLVLGGGAVCLAAYAAVVLPQVRGARQVMEEHPLDVTAGLQAA